MISSNETDDNKEVLAIDFGTVNTYISKCSANECLPQGIHFSSSKPGISTAVLERQGKSLIVGDLAIEEYSEATEKERKEYKLYTQFKPEIETSEFAQELATKFLITVLQDSEKQKIDLSPLSKQVIFGAPCAIKNGLNKELSFVLTEIAKKAGYGDIKVIEEPVGALLYHIATGSISAVDAQKEVLVIDFGGGSCDFSLMKKGNILKSWGEKYLGGRLFDDLFFQWFINDNPNMLKKLKKENRELFTLMVECKEVKEKFSEMVTLDENVIMRKSISQYGFLDNISWEAFLEKAHNYTISKTFNDYIMQINTVSNSQFDGKIDLLSWFEKSLLLGLQDTDVKNENIKLVILAGGSSLWKFVMDIVKVHFPNSNIVRSNIPYATISEGLALIPALKKRNNKVQKELLNELPTFCNGNKKEDGLRTVINNIMDSSIQEISNKITIDVFEAIEKPILLTFRENGGSINELNKSFEQKSDEIKNIINLITTQNMKVLKNNLESEIRQRISLWFKKHNIGLSNDQILQEGFPYRTVGKVIDNVDILYNVINTIIAGITGITVTVLCSEPVTLIIGLIIAFFTTLIGSDQLEKLLNKKYIPSKITKVLLTDKKIEKMKRIFNNEIVKKLNKNTKEIINDSMNNVMECIKNEIQALNEINTY